jgi:hypothetical protein
MKAMGLGAPNSVRVRFDASEIDVLVDVLREERADATRDAADSYAATPEQTRAVDNRHDRLRAVEALLMQLEEQPHTTPRKVLVGETELMCGVIREAAREALRRLEDAYERYEDRASPQSRDALLDAAKTAKAWIGTLTAVDRVDLGWDA